MKDESRFERDLTSALRFEKGSGFEWVEWSTSEYTVKKNLQDGESVANIFGVYVAYRKKKKKSKQL